jgi:hypothetical protein
MFKGEDAFVESNVKLQTMQGLRVVADEDGDCFDEQLSWANSLIDFHKFLLEKKSHIREYKKMRKMHGEILDNMMDYYYAGNFEQKFNNDCTEQQKFENKKGDNKIILLESSFDMESNVGSQAFADIMIYKNFPNKNCITEEFIKTNRYRKLEKIEFLHSMIDAKLGLFEVTGIDSDEGYANVKEVFTGREYKLTDMGLSGSFASYKNTYIYTRIITYRSVNFSTGLNFVFAKKDAFIQKFINRHKKDHEPFGEFVRFTELYNRFSKNPNKIKLIRNSFR